MAMLIRKEQMEALEDAQRDAFETRMLARLRQYFPKHPEFLEERQLRKLIRLSVERSASYGMSSERSATLYLDLMCVLGAGFDQDPLLPWTQEILQDPAFPSQVERMNALYSQGWEFAVHASEDFQQLLEHNHMPSLVAAISEIQNASTASLSPQQAGQLRADLALRLIQLFPKKSEYAGAARVSSSVRHAFERAEGYGLLNARAASLFAVIMFVVGAGFDTDPQLPWASRVLQNSDGKDSTAVTGQLYQESLQCLRQWWDIGAKQSEVNRRVLLQ